MRCAARAASSVLLLALASCGGGSGPTGPAASNAAARSAADSCGPSAESSLAQIGPETSVRWRPRARGSEFRRRTLRAWHFAYDVVLDNQSANTLIFVLPSQAGKGAVEAPAPVTALELLEVSAGAGQVVPMAELSRDGPGLVLVPVAPRARVEVTSFQIALRRRTGGLDATEGLPVQVGVVAAAEVGNEPVLGGAVAASATASTAKWQRGRMGEQGPRRFTPPEPLELLGLSVADACLSQPAK